METVGIFEAKTKLSEIVKRAERGESITITVNGIPKARVAPLEPEKPKWNEPEREAAFQRLMNPRITGISGDEVLAAIREGRR